MGAASLDAVRLLEVAANSVASALAAQTGGAGRVELCTALELGGLTPSSALIAMTREQLTIPLYVLIRPRAGDFLYSDLEHELMRRDIETCAALGCDGVVLGVLDAAGQVDMARCRELIAAAGPMGVTFHRAFDLSRDPAQALEDVITLGCERVLTSGTQASALDGVGLIADLIRQAAGRISIMPGAGVTAQNIAQLAAATGAHEFHASAKRQLASGMQHLRPGLHDMQGGEWRSDVEQVRALIMAWRAQAPAV
ncbi:copper homeostasis protein CutC [Dyella silvatica]|uniref:copper homeostasis protein CutC n=1 Tax=Dyella silvatica TaxID=2992128 RepID=UPI0022575A2A|nr:copper homeostasis protein CutC [Dyella silvatica]